MSVSAAARFFRIANISSCLRMVLAFSTPFSSANETSSAGVLDLRSWSLISRIGVVLWSNFQREGMRGGFRESGHEKRGPQFKARKAPEGFKPDAAAGLDRDATTSACVGWDLLNIENQLAFRKQRQGPTRPNSLASSAHQNGLTTTRMTIAIISTVGTSLIIR